jgi:ABC-type transport system involved in multi-copper enzyme maturation permease subunit
MSIFGPLFHYELTRLARRGLQPKLRGGFAFLLLGALFITYLPSLPGVSPIRMVFGLDEAMPMAAAAKFGERFLTSFLVIQLIVVVVVTPVMAGGAITDEKERKTLDFLLASPLTNREIVLGKMAARLVFVGGVVLTGLPVLALTMLFGGVDLGLLLSGYAITLLTMFSLGTLSLYLAVVYESLVGVLWRSYLVIVWLTVCGFCGGCLFFPALMSPFSALVYMLIRDKAFSSLPTEQTSIVGSYTVVHVLAAVWFLSLAIQRVRQQQAKQPVKRPPPVPANAFPRDDDLPPVQSAPVPDFVRTRVPHLGRRRYVPPLRDGNDPLVWKERWFGVRSGTTLDDLPDPPGMLGCGAFLAAFVGIFILALGFLAPAHSVSILLLPGMMLGVGVLAARSVASERQNQTLDSLLTLPGDRREILRAKALIAIRGVWPLVYLLAAYLFVGLITIKITVTSVILTPVLIGGWVGCALGFGMWLSCRCRTPARATGHVLAAILAACILPPLVTPLAQDSMSARHSQSAGWVDALVTGLGPASGALNALGPPDSLEDRDIVIRPIPAAGALCGAVLAALTGLGFWRAAGRRFDDTNS